MPSDYFKQKMIERLTMRKDQFLAQYDRVVRRVQEGKVGGEGDRLWMEAQVKGLKHGLDICCGDFIATPESEGVDGDYRYIGATWHTQGDELANIAGEWADFVTTNYLDAFPDTYKVLNEWKRVLKPGGILAIVCCNADKYGIKDGGPLTNRKRLSLYTKTTIAQWLYAVGFTNVVISDGEGDGDGPVKTMRVRAVK